MLVAGFLFAPPAWAQCPMKWWLPQTYALTANPDPLSFVPTINYQFEYKEDCNCDFYQSQQRLRMYVGAPGGLQVVGVYLTLQSMHCGATEPNNDDFFLLNLAAGEEQVAEQRHNIRDYLSVKVVAVRLRLRDGNNNLYEYEANVPANYYVTSVNGKRYTGTAPAGAANGAGPNNPAGLRQQGEQLYQQKNYTAAYRLLKQAAEQGDAAAVNTIVDMLSFGNISLSDKETLNWFQKGARQGNGRAQETLGIFYRDGRYLPKNYQQAKYWLEQSLAHGNRCSAPLALLYFNGWGVPQNYTEAFRLYTTSLDCYDNKLYANLGYLYETGKGTQQDLQKARDYYQKVVSSPTSGSAADLARAREGLARLARRPAESAPALTRQELTGTWHFVLSWPASANLGPVRGQLTLAADGDGSLSGSARSDEGQRLNLHFGFSKGTYTNNTLRFEINTDVAGLVQRYALDVLGRTRMKGTVTNIRTRPMPDRPEAWDQPAVIELSR